MNGFKPEKPSREKLSRLTTWASEAKASADPNAPSAAGSHRIETCSHPLAAKTCALIAEN